jgi:hypothetical protein
VAVAGDGARAGAVPSGGATPTCNREPNEYDSTLLRCF